MEEKDFGWEFLALIIFFSYRASRRGDVTIKKDIQSQKVLSTKGIEIFRKFDVLHNAKIGHLPAERWSSR